MRLLSKFSATRAPSGRAEKSGRVDPKNTATLPFQSYHQNSFPVPVRYAGRQNNKITKAVQALISTYLGLPSAVLHRSESNTLLPRFG